MNNAFNYDRIFESVTLMNIVHIINIPFGMFVTLQPMGCEI